MLRIHRAERADGLIEGLRTLLVDPLPDPFCPEVICVPTRGMERWLTQRVSARLGTSPDRSDGVCANVEFPSPHRLIGDAVAVACAIDPAEDPWVPERMVWPLLEVADECLGEPWLRTLSAHLDGAGETPDPNRRARRLSTLRHLADLFDRYALHRPEMVRGWARERGGEGADRGSGADAAWQAELWRRVRERIAQPSPAERLEAACARIRHEPELIELPQRISLFGLTRLPAGHLDVLRAIAAGRDVHLWLLHPSPALWQRIARAERPATLRRSDDHTAALPMNHLLASWGRDAREMQLVVGTDRHANHHHGIEQPDPTLLGRIQADVRADRPPSGVHLPGREDTRPLLDPRDESVQIHSCHGRARQVEVVRDAILHLLEEDPSLEPRDVIVMCPDIETFAPLIQATFGAGGVAVDDEGEAAPPAARPPDLRVRLADRSLRQTNPVLGVVAQLIDLAERRLTASEVLDLADREPVRWRFRFDDDDLGRIQAWVSDSGIRWGLDAGHRAAFKLDTLDAGTWRKGLDRLMTGVAMTEDELRLFAGVLPLDDIDSGAIELAGRLAELIDRLGASLHALSGRKTIDAWAAAVVEAANALTGTAERDAWQRSELDRLLGDVVDEATSAGVVSGTRIELAELRALLADRLQGRPTRANFRTGHLTVCTLVPMRSVPHRVVCLLGLDDGAFPRKSPRDGDDLMLDDPHLGDRDPRAEDRQLLLDALLAAGDRLVITYTGNDERTNAPQPPAVPVSELLDTIDATARGSARPAREQVLIRHPLQPFDPRNFAADALVPGRSWSFDPVTLDGARALAGPRAQPAPFLENRLAPLGQEVIDCEDLVRFVQHPVRAFLRQRLNTTVGDFSDELEDHLRVELDALQKWGVGQRLLEAQLAGVDGRDAVLAEIARGTLPPGVLGKPVIDEVFPVVAGIASCAQGLDADGSVSPNSIDVRVALPDWRTLSGTIPGVSGSLLRAVTYSKVAAKHRLAAWVRLLALIAARPARDYTAATVGRGERSPIAIARIRPPAERRDEWALDHLKTLVDLYDRGMREPLPLYCKTSAAYARATAAGRDAVAAARKEWCSDHYRDREDREAEHRRVLGGVRTFEELLHESPRSDEDGAGWPANEPTRLGRLARRLWDGPLVSEAIEQR